MEDNDDDKDVGDITVVLFFGMPDEAFIGKETDNKKKKGDEEEKRKSDENESGKNSGGGGANRGGNMREFIDRPATKGDNEDNDHNFGVRVKEGAEWEITKGARTTTKISRRRMRRKNRGGGVSAADENAK